MKAISPMIAVVLLIAFTIAVGGILSLWLSSLTTTQTTTVTAGTEKQVKCAASSLAVKEVRYNATDLSCCGAGTNNETRYTNVTVRYDSGTERLGPNITVEVIRRGVRSTTNVNKNLTAGESYGVSVNVTGSSGAAAWGAPEIVRARTFCQDTVPIVAECKSGEPCMISF